ncbi:MAG TPA: hypothetical protein VGB72_02335 [Acidobacteriota bacterium]
MTSRSMRISAWATVALLMAAGGSLLSQEAQPVPQAAPDKILGAWNLEVVADYQSYYVNITLQLTEGVLTGTASEPSGTFTDVPLSDIAFDGATLKFGFKSPTPPDGLERAIWAELKIVDEKAMEGTITVPDLAITATAKATKQ